MGKNNGEKWSKNKPSRKQELQLYKIIHGAGQSGPRNEKSIRECRGDNLFPSRANKKREPAWEKKKLL